MDTKKRKRSNNKEYDEEYDDRFINDHDKNELFIKKGMDDYIMNIFPLIIPNDKESVRKITDEIKQISDEHATDVPISCGIVSENQSLQTSEPILISESPSEPIPESTPIPGPFSEILPDAVPGPFSSIISEPIAIPIPDPPPILIPTSTPIAPAYPRDLIIIVNSHGLIPCSNDRYNNLDPNTYVVPDGIELIKFTLSAPGIVNIVYPITVMFYVSLINEYFYQIARSGTSEIYLNLMVEGFKAITNNIKNKLKNNMDDDDVKNFMHHINKGFNYYILNSGDKIVDKIYSRKVSEYVERSNDMKICEMKHKLNILKSPEGHLIIPLMPDLLFRLYPINENTPKDEEHFIRLSQMVDYYKNLGIKKLIVFDFTCSTFNKERNRIPNLAQALINLDPRQERRIRRRLCESGTCQRRYGLPYGGKYKKSKTKRLKTKRMNKKRMKTKRMKKMRI
jgi:hypothetical protein